MRIWALSLFAIFTVPQDDLDELIRQLGANDLADRERAMEDLVKKGPAALEKLKAATKDSDPEIALRAQQAIEQIERNETVRKVVPEGRRVTVDRKDAAIDDIAKALEVEIRIPETGRTVSLQVRDVELLRAVDALARELRLDWRMEGKAIVFGTDPWVEYPTAYSGAIRFRIKSIRATSENSFQRRSGELEFSIDVDMETGASPAGTIQVLAIEDQGGQKIEWDKDEPQPGRGMGGFSMSTMTINGKTIRIFEENGKLRVVVDDPGSAPEGKRVTLRNLKKPASKLSSLRGEMNLAVPGEQVRLKFDAVTRGTTRSAGDLEATIEESLDDSIVLAVKMKDGSPAVPDFVDMKGIRIRCGDEEFPATVVDATDAMELGRGGKRVMKRPVQQTGQLRLQILLPRAVDSITVPVRQVVQHRVPFEFRDVDLR